MKTRLLTSFYITVTLVLLFISRIFTNFGIDLLLGILAVVGAVEVARVFERQKKYNTIILAGLYPAMLYISYIAILGKKLSWIYYFIAFGGILVLFFLLSVLITYIFKADYEREVKKYNITMPKFKYALFKALNTSFILIYPTMFFGFAILLNNIALMPDYVIKIAGFKGYKFFTIDIFFILLAILLTVTSDSMAMITGMLLKGPKLCPRISPKKTISGAIGGLVGGVLSSILLYWIFTSNSYFAGEFARFGGLGLVALIGLIGSITCQLGDIFASFLKRKARVKDYGTIFPGHGGVMDRVDGLIITCSVVFAFAVILLASI